MDTSQGWLAKDESRAGQKDGGESVGHASGRRVPRILGKKKDELTDGDREHLREVVGYVNRHLGAEAGRTSETRSGATHP